jgi:hypothetical protein
MKLFITLYPLVFISSLLLVSCGDDPKLVEKREKQKTEITRLNGELAIIEEKIKAMPADASIDLSEAKKTAENQVAEVGLLETEVAKLEARKLVLQGEYQAYKTKYQLK